MQSFQGMEVRLSHSLGAFAPLPHWHFFCPRVQLVPPRHLR